MTYEEMLRQNEIREMMAFKKEEERRRQGERYAEMSRQEAAFQEELRERADGKPKWEWKRPWEC